MKALLKRTLPPGFWQSLRNLRHGGTRAFRRAFESAGLVVARKNDYYSPLPSDAQLRQNQHRWAKPSLLNGLRYDLAAMKTTLQDLVRESYPAFTQLPPYTGLCSAGYGPGYPQLDAFTLFAMIRRLRPATYMEVGSGLSTYYTHLARLRTPSSSSSSGGTRIICVEPYPYPKLGEIAPIELIESEVQDVDLSRFQSLKAGDVLFIDSSHAVRIDGDVPYLFLEVLPALAPGVYIHIHDIPLPYNVPYPPRYWTLVDDHQSPHWPMFWTEAMLIQAFLAFNSAFEIVLSTPLIRHYDEPFLREHLPIYQSVNEEPNTFSSLWLRRVASSSSQFQHTGPIHL